MPTGLRGKRVGQGLASCSVRPTPSRRRALPPNPAPGTIGQRLASYSVRPCPC